MPDLGRWPRWPRWLRGAEPRLLTALVLLTGLLLAAGKLVEDVVNHESRSFDRAILLALRANGDPSTPIGPAWLSSAAVNITAIGSPTIITLVTIVATLYLVIAGQRRLSVLVALSIVLGAIAEKSLKFAVGRQRPDIISHLVTETSLSFPSGHTTLSAFTYLTIGALIARAEKRPGVRAFILLVSVAITLLVGLSRIYVGVHWPTDVLGGWAIGAAWALVTWLIAEWLRPQRGAPLSPR